MRQKHLGLLESSRGPPDHVKIDTCLVSDHTYQWGPFVINDFSNLTKSHPWTVIHPRWYLWKCPLEANMFKKKRASKGKYTFKRQKESNPDMRLCWYGCIMIQTWSHRGDSIFVEKRKESLGSEIGFVFGIYCLSQRRNRDYDPEGFLCMRVCVCVCVHACGRSVGTTPSEFSWWPSTPLLSAKPRAGTWVPQDDRTLSCPSLRHDITGRRKHALWGAGGCIQTYIFPVVIDLSLNEESPRTALTVCRAYGNFVGWNLFFWREIFVLLLLVILY